VKIEEALRDLPVGNQAKRLRLLLPAIEAKLAEGVPHAEILALLNRHGFSLREETYKVYLYRYRKERRAHGTGARSEKARTSAAGVSGQTPGLPASSDVKRPPTFEYDPRGIPELLK
jgi:hypothetical protein